MCIFKEQFIKSVNRAKQKNVFLFYQKVVEWVMCIINDNHEEERVSEYWKEEIKGFGYMLDASPLIIENLREHCYHLTGLLSYQYRKHHFHLSKPIEQKYNKLLALDDEDLFVPESPLLGGFGHTIDGYLINLDTLKFYEFLLGLKVAGFLKQFKQKSVDRKVITEIGAGWGGFAYQFKTLFPDTSYVIIDLPQTLLFSSVYLFAQFPNASIYLYDKETFSELKENYSKYDFIFLPHYILETFPIQNVDLSINMVSFQEMTTTQVERYVRKFYESGCKQFYSLNRDRSPHNPQLSSVSSILRSYYEIQEVRVLGVPYTDLSTFSDDFFKRIVNESIQQIKALIHRRKKNDIFSYRHFAGTLRDSGNKGTTMLSERIQV